VFSIGKLPSPKQLGKNLPTWAGEEEEPNPGGQEFWRRALTLGIF
jgi:hypothetical protein